MASCKYDPTSSEQAHNQSSMTHRLTAPPARVVLDVRGNLEFFTTDVEVKHVVVNNAMRFWIQTLKTKGGGGGGGGGGGTWIRSKNK